MRLTDKLRRLDTYFACARQVGHTALLRQGFDNWSGDKLILTTNMKEGHKLKCLESQIVTLDSLDRLQGRDWPMLVDNSVLVHLFHSAILELEGLESENKKLYKKVKELEYGNISKSTPRRTGRDERRGVESRSNFVDIRREI